MIRVKTKLNFDKIETFLKDSSASKKFLPILEKYGKQGVQALQSATPVNSGNTASSWSYEIVNKGNEYSISFSNSNINNGVNIAIILQYGHGTRNGGYVQGRDYINPAIKQVFDEMTNELSKEVGHL